VDVEAGVKSEFSVADMAVRTNLDVYHGKYTTSSERRRWSRKACWSISRAAPRGPIQGIEFEGVLVPVAGVELSANYAYTDSKYTHVTDAEAARCWRVLLSRTSQKTRSRSVPAIAAVACFRRRPRHQWGRTVTKPSSRSPRPTIRCTRIYRIRPDQRFVWIGATPCPGRWTCRCSSRIGPTRLTHRPVRQLQLFVRVRDAHVRRAAHVRAAIALCIRQMNVFAFGSFVTAGKKARIAALAGSLLWRKHSAPKTRSRKQQHCHRCRRALVSKPRAARRFLRCAEQHATDCCSDARVCRPGANCNGSRAAQEVRGDDHEDVMAGVPVRIVSPSGASPTPSAFSSIFTAADSSSIPAR